MESKNLVTFCITNKKKNILNETNLKIIVGGSHVKNEKFPNTWLLDSNNINISSKNKNFGSLTSIYSIWKNEINKYNQDTWIGISHYRRLWLKENHERSISLINLNRNLLSNISEENLNFDAFIPNPQNLTGYKLMKLLKKARKNIFKDPLILFNKKKHTINLHFDMFHLYGGLTKAASVMSKNEQGKFLNYINQETEYFPFSIFILKRDKFDELCQSTFEWISNCEQIFDIKNFNSYGQIRFFDFLAERYFSFWIKNNTNYKICPFVFIDPKLKGDFKIF
jgi:hypothetical protein